MPQVRMELISIVNLFHSAPSRCEQRHEWLACTYMRPTYAVQVKSLSKQGRDVQWGGARRALVQHALAERHSRAIAPESPQLSSSARDSSSEADTPSNKLWRLAAAGAPDAADSPENTVSNKTDESLPPISSYADVLDAAIVPDDNSIELQPAEAPLETSGDAAPADSPEGATAAAYQPEYMYHKHDSDSNSIASIVLVTVGAVAATIALGMIGMFVNHQRALKTCPGGAAVDGRTACAACAHSAAEAACLACGTLCCFCCAAH
jgi:hypothetical protein